MSILLVILDGLGDLPSKEFNGKTPLEKAKTPHMNLLAKNGKTGLHRPLGDKKPESDTAHLAIFGYDLDKYYLGRGPYEAAGVGLEMIKGDVAFRVNAATVDENSIIKDRRAGRIKNIKPFVEKFNGKKLKDVKFILKSGTEHRAVLLMRGANLYPNVTGNDPHKEGKKVLDIEQTKMDSGKTAHLLSEFLKISHEELEKMDLNKKRKKQGKLPINYFLVRGAGQFKKTPDMKKMHGLNSACIAGAGLYKGVAKVVGMDLLDSNLNGTEDENIQDGVDTALNALKNYDFVFLHLKLTDLFGHDGDFKGKVNAIERVDKCMEKLTDLDHTICITGDHSTPCLKKDHSTDPVPILISGKGKDKTKKFDEKECGNGNIGQIQGKDIMNLIK